MRLVHAIACGAIVLLAPWNGAADEEKTSTVIDVSEPAQGALVGRLFHVAGTIREGDAPATGTCRVNGRTAELREGRFDVRVQAPGDGPFVVRVVRGEAGGPTQVREVRVDVDGSPPLLEITDPPEGRFEVQGPQATIRGWATDAHGFEVRMNGTVVPVAVDGTFEATLAVREETGSIANVRAEDVLETPTRYERAGVGR